MTYPAIFSAATTINIPQSTVNNRVISPLLCDFSSHYSLRITNSNTRRSNSNLFFSIKSSAIIDTQTPESEQNQVLIGARVRVSVPLMVYHIPKVPEVDLNGKEGTIKENVTVWKGKHISANFPYKIEFFEKLEGRGENPVKFSAHLREDEFEYID